MKTHVHIRNGSNAFTLCGRYIGWKLSTVGLPLHKDLLALGFVVCEACMARLPLHELAGTDLEEP